MGEITIRQPPGIRTHQAGETLAGQGDAAGVQVEAVAEIYLEEGELER